MSPTGALLGLPALVTGGDESIWVDCDNLWGRTVGSSRGAGSSLGRWTVPALELAAGH